MPQKLGMPKMAYCSRMCRLNNECAFYELGLRFWRLGKGGGCGDVSGVVGDKSDGVKGEAG